MSILKRFFKFAKTNKEYAAKLRHIINNGEDLSMPGYDDNILVKEVKKCLAVDNLLNHPGMQIFELSKEAEDSLCGSKLRIDIDNILNFPAEVSVFLVNSPIFKTAESETIGFVINKAIYVIAFAFDTKEYFISNLVDENGVINPEMDPNPSDPHGLLAHCVFWIYGINQLIMNRVHTPSDFAKDKKFRDYMISSNFRSMYKIPPPYYSVKLNPFRSKSEPRPEGFKFKHQCAYEHLVRASRPTWIQTGTLPMEEQFEAKILKWNESRQARGLSTKLIIKGVDNSIDPKIIEDLNSRGYTMEEGKWITYLKTYRTHHVRNKGKEFIPSVKVV